MCSAIFLRITLIGSTVPGTPANLFAGVAGRGVAGTSAAAAAGVAYVGADGACGAGALGGAPAGYLAMNVSMSSFVIRPPEPVPVTWRRSTLCSCASLRTTGEDLICPSSPAAGGATGTAAGGGVGVVAAGLAGAAGAAAGAAGCAGAPVPPLTPTTVLTCTVVPGWTLISVRVPAEGA